MFYMQSEWFVRGEEWLISALLHTTVLYIKSLTSSPERVPPLYVAWATGTPPSSHSPGKFLNVYKSLVLKIGTAQPSNVGALANFAWIFPFFGDSPWSWQESIWAVNSTIPLQLCSQNFFVSRPLFHLCNGHREKSANYKDCESHSSQWKSFSTVVFQYPIRYRYTTLHVVCTFT